MGKLGSLGQLLVMYVSFKKNIRYIGKVIHISHHLGTLLLRIRLIMAKMLRDLSIGD